MYVYYINDDRKTKCDAMFGSEELPQTTTRLFPLVLHTDEAAAAALVVGTGAVSPPPAAARSGPGPIAGPVPRLGPGPGAPPIPGRRSVPAPVA